MPSFTVELWRAIELAPDGDIGLNDYPIFDPAYRETLNQKIIDQYYNQEIATETVSMFRLAMRRKMHQIMPYYNQLYESERLNIDPLFTIDVRTETTTLSDTDQTTTGTANTGTESKSRAVGSEFPQNRLAGDMDYASSASDTISDTTAENETTENLSVGVEGSSESHTSGIQGSQADMLMRYRETFLNIDVSIINELSDLFMSVWGTSDEYSNRLGI